jgi:hypothetical protein
MDDILDGKGTQSDFNGTKTLPNATATLVLGIVSIATCWLYGIIGLVCGIIAIVLYNKDKKLYLENPVAYHHSYKNSKGGYVCGIIGICLSAFMIIYIAVILIVIGSVFSGLMF